MRVERTFAFVDLCGFTHFTSTHGDERAVDVLTRFRAAVRAIGSSHGVRVAKWLGDGAMFVAVDARQLVCAMLEFERIVDQMDLPLEIHAGLAGGQVILLEGDDYTGGPVNLASRLADAAGPCEILATPELAALAPEGSWADVTGPMVVPGFRDPVKAVRIGPSTTEPRVTPAP